MSESSEQKSTNRSRNSGAAIGAMVIAFCILGVPMLLFGLLQAADELLGSRDNPTS